MIRWFSGGRAGNFAALSGGKSVPLRIYFLPAPAAKTETFLLPLKNVEDRIIIQIHIFEADRTEFLAQKVYSSLSGRRAPRR